MLVKVRTGSRLHLGFTSLSSAPSPWSGIGLMIEDPGVTVRVSSPGRGRLDCSDEHAELVRSVVRALGSDLSALDIGVEATPLHVGLGTTTQLSLAVGMALSVLSGSEFDVLRVARLTGRGRRSWIG
ncbi:MAG: hypothetical protein NZ988_00600, partial [Thaumarchaeota archaeon]|nr:hypothetical protein [Candidatus Calditenuaceae archaeon]MDW8186535.1 hypothetical protein [Nitrososphaerota archaeon]